MSIHDIAKAYLQKVKKSGAENVMAICPFHRKADGSSERGPSFSMNIYSGLWYCHSCHLRGNLRTFLRGVGVSYADIEFRYQATIEEAATHSPIKADPLHFMEEKVAEPLPERMLGLFDKCPTSLLDEGYPIELLQRFDIGFDEKHMRITFPLRDWKGTLVGISGRTVIDEEPRYKIYEQEYVDFGLEPRKTTRRRLLWNFDNVLGQFSSRKDATSQCLVVVEGFKAVMRVAQAGISSVVGLLGSDMSDEQRWLIERLECPVVLMLDNNYAGRRGQYFVGRKLVKTTAVVKVAEYEGDQPSDLTTTAIQNSLHNTISFTSWLLKTPLN